MYFRIFDCWRLTAAMLVMSYHFLFYAPAGGEAGIAFLHRLLPLLDMFFMISGFFITTLYRHRLKGPGDYLTFLRKRVARLYPLHLLTLSFFVAIAVGMVITGFSSGEPRRWDLALLPFHLLAVHAWGTTDYLAFNYVSWSVSAEFFCYILFPLIVVLVQRKGLGALAAFSALWIAGLEIASAAGVFPHGHWTTADNLGAYRAFADFQIGAMVAILVERRVFDIRSHWPGLAFLGVAGAAMILEWNVYLVLAGFAGAMLCTALAETARPHSTDWLGFLMPITRVSFGIYLWHPVMEMLFLGLLWKHVLAPAGFTGFYVFWLLPMLATIAVALASERFFERRVARWLSGGTPRRASVTSLAA
ncbi:acyltransferase family protein [Consotaella aegiceratis]|uniref:acyltransferase family protein n=1 Tax=Consotaella aegiceratis TaxID=3097961 RepID=UPI002F3F7F8F